jgi:hypothetical protein
MHRRRGLKWLREAAAFGRAAVIRCRLVASAV